MNKYDIQPAWVYRNYTPHKDNVVWRKLNFLICLDQQKKKNRTLTTELTIVGNPSQFASFSSGAASRRSSTCVLILFEISTKCRKMVFGTAADDDSGGFSPHSSSRGLCCGAAGSGIHPWPASGPSPARTGPPCRGGCSSLPAAEQGTRRTCTSGHSPMTSLAG